MQIEQLFDFFQSEAEALHLADAFDYLHVLRSVGAIAGGGPLGRFQEFAAFVEADGADFVPGLSRKLSDAHVDSINPIPKCGLKRKNESVPAVPRSLQKNRGGGVPLRLLHVGLVADLIRTKRAGSTESTGCPRCDPPGLAPEAWSSLASLAKLASSSNSAEDAKAIDSKPADLSGCRQERASISACLSLVLFGMNWNIPGLYSLVGVELQVTSPRSCRGKS